MKPRINITTTTALVAVACAMTASIASAETASPWKFKAGVTIKETYDSNVYLQDTSPDPAIANALPANKTSLVTNIAVNTAWKWQGSDAFGFSFGYQPKAFRFHSAPDEDHVIHATTLKLEGHNGATVWSFQNAATWIDGSSEAPTFGGVGGAPALGGVPIRDRRNEFIERSSLTLTHTSGNWIIRPAATAFLQDFGIDQRNAPGYSNFIDRSEVMAGLDVGYEVLPKTHLVVGFRWGNQHQYKLHGIDSPYDSTIRRFILGIEGEPLAGLKLSLQAGPESRSYAPGTPAGFGRTGKPLWVNASATWKVSPHNSFIFAYTHRDLPASSSRSVYSDTTGKAHWKSQLNKQTSITTGIALARGDWRLPAVRNDRIYTTSVLLDYVLKSGYSLELGWSLDRAVTPITGKPGREFRRHQVTAGCQFTF